MKTRRHVIGKYSIYTAEVSLSLCNMIFFQSYQIDVISTIDQDYRNVLTEKKTN